MEIKLDLGAINQLFCVIKLLFSAIKLILAYRWAYLTFIFTPNPKEKAATSWLLPLDRREVI